MSQQTEKQTLDTSNTEPNVLMDVQKVKFRYKKNLALLEEINFHANSGEIIGISGENGTGKSTLLKILVGLIKPVDGTISHKGRIGYSPQNLLLFDNLTVQENFNVFGRGMNLSSEEILNKSQHIMAELNFHQYKDTLVKNLSGGTKQKVNFGISLLGDPDILVLDEPYQGMDYASFTAFWKIQFELRKQGKAVIIVSHMIEDQSKFTKSLHIINGKLQGCQRDDCPLCCEVTK